MCMGELSRLGLRRSRLVMTEEKPRYKGQHESSNLKKEASGCRQKISLSLLPGGHMERERE